MRTHGSKSFKKWAPHSPRRNFSKPQNDRSCLHYICTRVHLEIISESFVVAYISRRTTAILINGRKRDKWQAWAFLTRRSLFRVRTRNLAGWLCVCACVRELFLNRDLSHTMINHRTTHKTPPFTNRGSLFLACLPDPLTTNAEHRAIFSHSATRSIKAIIPRKKKFKGRAGWVKEQQRTAPCHTTCISQPQQKREESRETPFLSSFAFFSSLLDVDGQTEITKAGVSSRVSEIRLIWPREWIYLHTIERWPGLHGNIILGQGYAGLCDPSPVPYRHQWTAPNLSVTIDKKLCK